MSQGGEDLCALLRARRSIRRFSARPVERELITRALDAATWAPSAGNRQDWELVVVTRPALKPQLADAVRRVWEARIAALPSEAVAEAARPHVRSFDWFASAPVVVAVTTRRPESFLVEMFSERAAAVSGARISAAMAAQNLMLAAHALGLGSCCLTGPLAAERELLDLLGCSARRELVCLVALGYPAEAPAAPPRKPLEQVARFVE